MGFSRQEYWSGLPFPSPGDLPNPGIEPKSPTLQVDSLLFELPGVIKTCKANIKQIFPPHLSFSSVQFSHSVVSKSLRPRGL